jgi:phosphate starvation-inducible PhoH-like protein
MKRQKRREFIEDDSIVGREKSKELKKQESKVLTEKIFKMLDEEQKEVKKTIVENDITVLYGKAESGKSFLACYIALEMFNNKQVDKIIITRPTVSDEDLGFPPGFLEDKLQPWLQPLYENMNDIFGKSRVDTMMKLNQLQIAPISFCRGRTFCDSFVIVDETQNLTVKQTKMMLTRIGVGSKMVLTGDISQCDLKKKSDCGLEVVLNFQIKNFACKEMFTNHRLPIVDDILGCFDKYETVCKK